MGAAPVPPNEAERLFALREAEILDTPPEAHLDEIARLASRIYQVPIALVSLVDENRQWFKSRVGVDASETPRDWAFCAHAILNPNRPFTVRDAACDPRFRENPLVVKAPFIRFYTAVPLVTRAGFAIGTLCVIDKEPRNIAEADLEPLRVLSRQVMDQIELRRELRRLRSRAAEQEEEVRVRSREKADLEASLTDQNRYISHLAHEVRTPLSGMLSLTDLLLETPLDEEQADLAGSLRLAGTGLLSLLNSLLDLSRLESGKVAAEQVEIDLAPWLEALVDPFRREAAKKGLFFECLRAPSVPDRFFGDPLRLRQVVVNLLSNALRFTPRGRVTLELRREAEASGAGSILVFEVEDTGIGIAGPTLERLFQPFTQGGVDTARRFGGSGLGLSICAQLAELLGGRLEARSREGEGSRFSFSIPLRTEAG